MIRHTAVLAFSLMVWTHGLVGMYHPYEEDTRFLSYEQRSAPTPPPPAMVVATANCYRNLDSSNCCGQVVEYVLQMKSPITARNQDYVLEPNTHVKYWLSSSTKSQTTVVTQPPKNYSLSDSDSDDIFG